MLVIEGGYGVKHCCPEMLELVSMRDVLVEIHQDTGDLADEPIEDTIVGCACGYRCCSGCGEIGGG